MISEIQQRRRSTLAALVFGVAWLAGPAARAQAASPATHWELTAGAGLGAPSGWVQVRENTVDGTRLSLAADLRVHQVQTLELALDYAPSPAARYALTLTAFALHGATPPPGPVYFNGTTLAGDSALATSTQFSDFVAIELTGSWRVARVGNGDLSARAGLSFVALTFVLRGTLAAGSATRETQEDFVTQELPVPVIGVEYRLPLLPRLRLDAALGGGYLPWVNSLRSEGGVVTITQSEGELSLGARYDLSARLALSGVLRYSALTQREQSTEDGNEIAIRATTLSVALTARF